MESTTLFFTVAVVAQIAHPSPTLPSSVEGRGDTRVERVYGTPEPIDLWTLAAGNFNRQTIITKGRVRQLDARGAYYEIAEDNGRAVLFGVPEIAPQIAGFVGKRVEVVGLVRNLVAAQGTCLSRMQRVPQSLCDDPDLPPTPDLTPDRASWAPVSITAWSIVDASRADDRPSDDFATALGGAPGDKVRLRGRFGGANLDGRLSGPIPEAGAWSLVSEGSAVWIVGKPPRGTGFRLDPAYRGDVGKWLEVEGAIVRCAAGTCLRARRVLLAPTPKAVDP